MIGKAKPKPGNVGTVITVEDLFYNMPTRKKAMSNHNAELSKIIHVVERYALNNPGVSITLKKQGEPHAVCRTGKNTSVVDNMKDLFKDGLAQHLVLGNAESAVLEYKADVILSNLQYHKKRSVDFILFVNSMYFSTTQ